MNISEKIPGSAPAFDLESVILTAELSRRPSRAPDYAAENRALTALAQEMASSPDGILRKLAETALLLCQAHSFGISLLESDGQRFYWPVITGQWACHVGGGTPREFGPCGTVLDRNAAQLMSHPERHFTYLAPATPPIEEVLLLPFYVGEKAVGTIWVVSHETGRRFDAEDLRLMTSLCNFAAAAYHVSLAQKATTKANDELQQSEGRYRTLFNSMDEGFCIIQSLFDKNDTPQDYRYLEVNPAFEKQSGLTQVVGRTIKELVPGIERYWIETFGQVALTGTPVHVENYVAEMNRWFEVSALRVGDPASRRVVCLFTDISARKFAEAALAQEKARTENILFSITDAFLTLDRDWRFTYFNTRATEIFESMNAPADVLGKNIWEVFPDLVGSILEREYHRSMDERVSVTFEIHYQFELWLEITAYPSADGISVLFRNITERKDDERRNEFLAAFPQQLADATTEADLVRIAVEAVGSHLQVDRCYFVERHAQKNRLTLSHNWLRGPSPSLEGDYDLRDFDGPEWWRQYSGGASAIDNVSSKNYGVEDVKTDPFTRGKISSYEAVGIGAYAVQPFRRDGEWAVCLAITEAFPRKWTAYEMHILDDVVARVWPLVEHARNEQSLLESEKRFRALVTASSDVVYRMNADWSEMRQLDGRNFVNDTDGPSRTWFTDNIHAADQPQVRAVINEAIRTKSNFELEHRVRRVDGSFGWTFSRAIPQLDAKGEITEWFGAASDVSGRKEADDQLRAAHDSFRHLVEQSPFGIYAVDADFRLVLVSAGAQKVFENVRPLIGRDFAEVLRLVWPEPFVTQALTIFRRVLASGEPYHAPSTVEKRQDTAAEESYDWKVERITLPDGRPGAVCHFYDLSERKKAEDALRASVQRLRFMAESMPQKIFTAKPNGDTDYGNRQWLKFTGLTLEQIKDWGWTQFIHPEDVEETVRHWKQAVETGEHFQLEHRFRRHDGIYRWHLSLAHAMRGADDKVLMWIASSTDVTEMKNAQGALERASRSKDEFIAALSHELRTPLTPVLVAASLLREDLRLPADVREQLAMMERNILLEARLIDDLLDLTAITRGKLPLRAERCDAHLLIGLALATVRDDARGKGISIECNFAAHCSGLMADSTRFQQIIWNLLRNAVKFTPRLGKISIYTRDQKQPDGAGWLRIAVTDTGIGIEPESLEQIFLPFNQGTLAGEHRFGGVGLGLAIARAIVDLHGGRISAHSAGPNRGATFLVELPGAIEPPTGESGSLLPFADRLPATAAVPREVPRVAVPLRLLLVDDHVNTLQTLGVVLRRDGHHVITATNIAEALGAAAANKFDLVISDLGLPDGLGTELMKTLRATYGLRGIALSGYGMEADVARSHEAGFTVHLVKPVPLAELRRSIATFGIS